MFISKKSLNFAHVIELERHIEILLLSNDCVIVPDLGGFMAHHVEAQYDEEYGIFLPPLRTIGFNPQLTINDSLLALSYVEAYDISYPEALHRIEAEVNELKMHLQSEGSYELNNIGTLSLNDEGNYVFTPCEAGILTPIYYGLASYDIKRSEPVAKPEPAKVINLTPNPEPEQEVIVEEEVQDVDEEVVKVKYSWIRNTVAIAAVLLALFLLALPTGKTEMMTRTISNLNSNILFGMMSKDTNSSRIEIKKKDICNTHVTADTLLKKDTISQTSTVKEDSIKQGYCIVFASYVTKKNAQIFVEQLQQRGYQESEVYTHHNITRVIYGNFKTQEDAYQALHDIHQHKDLSEAWVYKFN